MWACWLCTYPWLVWACWLCTYPWLVWIGWLCTYPWLVWVCLPLVGVGMVVVYLPLVGVGMVVVYLPLVGVGMLVVYLTLVGVGMLVVYLPLVGMGMLVVYLPLVGVGMLVVYLPLVCVGMLVAGLGCEHGKERSECLALAIKMIGCDLLHLNIAALQGLESGTQQIDSAVPTRCHIYCRSMIFNVIIQNTQEINSLVTRRYDSYCQSMISNLIVQNSTCTMDSHSEIALRWMPHNLANGKSTLACCLTAPSHYLKHCWPRSMSPHNILTQCGLVMPYGDTDLGQHWLR